MITTPPRPVFRAPLPEPPAPAAPEEPAYESGVDPGLQVFRRLVGLLAGIGKSARELTRWDQPVHGVLCNLRENLRHALRLVEACLNEESEGR